MLTAGISNAAIRSSSDDPDTPGAPFNVNYDSREDPTVNNLVYNYLGSGLRVTALTDGPAEASLIGNHVITGAELLQATVSTGLKYGDMNVFHRQSEGSEKPVFSMANAAKPGHFERDEWNTFETGGVVLFMILPGPEQALDAWDAMLAAARRMAEILNADLLDGDRSPFTRQREAQYREEMRDYDRSKSALD